jgi:hypothetical protein
MAHVVNLIVQAILVELSEADDPEQDDYYIPNKHIPFHYDPDDDEEVLAPMSQAIPTVVEAGFFGSIKVPHPSNKQLCELMVIRDVVTQWNYTHAMIKRALLLRKVSLILPFILSST